MNKPPNLSADSKRTRWLAALGATVALLLLTGCGDGAAENPSVAASAAASAATEPTYASAWGPQVGARSPELAANDHTGQAQTLATLRGEKGLLLVFSRSADW